MGKKVQALIFVLAFLFFYLALLQFVGLTKANPMYSSTPIEPNRNSPVLAVQ